MRRNSYHLPDLIDINKYSRIVAQCNCHFPTTGRTKRMSLSPNITEKISWEHHSVTVNFSNGDLDHFRSLSFYLRLRYHCKNSRASKAVASMPVSHFQSIAATNCGPVALTSMLILSVSNMCQ